MTILRTILGDGAAVVVGLPVNFELTAALKTASEIRLATAFAHQSGWQHWKLGISKATGRVFLLAGLDCFQTEPKLLQAWLELKLAKSDRVDVRLASKSTFFHPKVLIVESEGAAPSFAIVGSGNLSNGGMQTNVECSLFVDDTTIVDALVQWFDSQLKEATPLTKAMIVAYEPKYTKAKKWREKLVEEQRQIDAQILSVGTASLQRWEEAVKEAKQYFLTAAFKTSYASRVVGSKRILKTLNVPHFNFNRADWNEFYSNYSLGRLDPRFRDKIFKKKIRLKTGLRRVIKEGERALPDVLASGALHIDGVGLATVTKILAAYEPKMWPVFNSRVEATLADFGYRPPRSAGKSGKYLAYRNTMKKFREACNPDGSIDAFALDSFFYHWSKLLEKKKTP